MSLYHHINYTCIIILMVIIVQDHSEQIHSNVDQGFHNARIFPGRRQNCVGEGSVLIACIMLSCHKLFVSPTPMRAALCKLLVEALMHVNVCCQIIVNAQNFIYVQYFPAFVNLYQVNVSTVKHSSCAMVLSFTGK